MKKRKPENNIGVIYARYSSHAQKDASIEQQVNEGYEFAAANGIEIIHVYSDRAVSGRTDQRPEFQRMMRDAEKGGFNAVIAWKSNRIGRNMLQAMVNEARLSDLGIRVMYIEESFDDTAAGRFALRSMMNVNQFYSENMAEDIRRGIRDNAMQCKVTNGTLPYGYKIGDQKQYEIDEQRAAVVREIFSRVASGDAFVDIATDLNRRGITTTRGGQWNKCSFQRLIKNERYRGIYIYDDIRVDGGIPRIISDELFYKTQEVLKTKKNPQGRHRVGGDYLLTGKLFCGKCGSAMTGLSGTNNSGAVYYYYACHTKRTQHTCDMQNVRRDEIELAVARAIYDYALQDDVIDWIAKSTVAYNKRHDEESHVPAFQAELADVKRSTKNLLTAIEQGIITDSTRTRLIELETRQSELTAKIAAAKADIVDVPYERIAAGLKLFRVGNIRDKKLQSKLFDTFLRAVYVYDDHLKIVFSFSGNRNTLDTALGEEIRTGSDAPDIDFCLHNLSDGSPKPLLKWVAVFCCILVTTHRAPLLTDMYPYTGHPV